MQNPLYAASEDIEQVLLRGVTIPTYNGNQSGGLDPDYNFLCLTVIDDHPKSSQASSTAAPAAKPAEHMNKRDVEADVEIQNKDDDASAFYSGIMPTFRRKTGASSNMSVITTSTVAAHPAILGFRIRFYN